MTFDVYTKIDTGFNNFEELGDIATAALRPYTDQQYINFSYSIINKKGKYKIGLRECNKKGIANKTWAAFKTHFCIAYQ